MATTTRLVELGPSGAVPTSTLEVPEQWRALPVPDGAVGALSDGRSLSRAIETNLVLTATTLPEGATLPSWQASVRAERLAALPDLQILDERATTSPEGEELWHSSSVMTDPQGVTILTRRWSRIAGDTGLTLTLTTLPLTDAAHDEMLDRIVGTWKVLAAPGKEPNRAHR